MADVGAFVGAGEVCAARGSSSAMDLRAAAEAAFAAAACEGLTLVRSDNATGFKGVCHRKASKS